MKLKDLLGVRDEQAEFVKDILFGYALGFASALIGFAMAATSL